MHSPGLMNVKLCFTFLKVSDLCKLFGFLCMENLSILPYLFIQSFISVQFYSYSILCFVTQYYYISLFTSFHFQSLGALTGSHISDSLTDPHHCGFHKVLSYYMVLQDALLSSCTFTLQSYNQPFL